MNADLVEGTKSDPLSALALIGMVHSRPSDVRWELEQLSFVLNSITQGICLFDSQLRLVFSNRQYAELYGLTADQVTPGTHLDDILSQCHSKGWYASRLSDEYLTNILRVIGQRKSASWLDHLSDGRKLYIRFEPQADGGWVATHEDITALHNAMSKSESAGDELISQRLAIDQAAIVSITDRHGSITAVNDRFCEISGYARNEIIGQTHRTVRSGFHSPEFYQNIHKCISSGQNWRGELCNKKKSGKMYWVDTTIVPRIGLDGCPTGYMSVSLDITPRKLAQIALAESNNRVVKTANQLSTVLDNVDAGVCMYGADRKVVVGNENYATMYGLTREDILPGTPLHVVINRRITVGIYAFGDPDVYRRESNIAVTHAGNFIHFLNDGRVVSISRRPTVDGGWITVHRDITDQYRASERITHLAQHDSLTGLPNRLTLGQRIEAELARAKRGSKFALHFVDLDRFKFVNDTLGHLAGDALLVTVAKRLVASVREADMVARLGGDEFAIVQTNVRQSSDAMALADRVINAVDAPVDLNGHAINVGASIGIALAPDNGGECETLLRNADLALYEAKERGRGNAQLFVDGLRHEMMNRRLLESDLRNALEAGELRLHYQPIVSLSSGMLTGCEALIRWMHPTRGLVSPAEFIPIAEETGLIAPIGAWAIQQACHAAAAWPGSLKVAVNLSAAQFHSGGIVEAVSSALATANINPERLELEITESLLLDESESVCGTLHELRALGVRIALDDFGTGYSSLSYLLSFPFDKIKIDRIFVKDLDTEPRALAIVSAITSLAKALGMMVTAEGIETEHQRLLVAKSGCSEYQGYLFSPPREEREIAAMLLPEKEAAESRIPRREPQ